MKHFEEIYEECEQLSEKDDAYPFGEIIDDLIVDIQTLESIQKTSTPARQQEIFGDILFSICTISKRLNINAYEALQNAMNKFRAGILDDE